MAVTLVQPTDPIEVKQICCLIYGQPGSRKSSLAQTAENPITLAFDPGIYRAYGRKTAALFDTWQDVVEFDLSNYRTPSVDTVGMCLAKLGQSLIAENGRNGNKLGGLSLQGYGALKERFKSWVESCKARGQNLVFIAQEKEDRNGDESYFRPDIVGASYNTLMENCDIVGYMHFDNGRRVLDFNPTDRWMAKAPPCGWKQFELPDFSAQPDFLAKLLSEAKASMGRISEASAAIARVVEEWRVWLETANLEKLNNRFPEIKQLERPIQHQVWAAVQAAADRYGLIFDKAAKCFIEKPSKAPPLQEAVA